MLAEPCCAVKVGPAQCLCVYGDTGESAESELLIPPEREVRRKRRLSSPGAGRAAAPLLGADGSRERTSSCSSSALPSPSQLKGGITFNVGEDAPSDDAESLDGEQPSSHRALTLSMNDILVREKVGHTTSLVWVEAVFAKLWPKVDTAIKKIVKLTVEPRIQEKLPGPLKGLCFTKFTLGKSLPKIESVDIWEAPCHRKDLEQRGLEVHLQISLDSNVDIEMSIGGVRAGIHSITLKGTLVIRLDPLLHREPIVGGIVAYFLDPPKIDMQFAGLAHIADSHLLSGTVRSVIDSTVANHVVLPNVIHQTLVHDETIVDSAALRDPKPVGVLRVSALAASGLTGVDRHLFSKATSDPYLRLTLGACMWQSSVQFKTCDPEWPATEMHDFLVYDREQKFCIDVLDWGYLKVEDLIGRARPLMVFELLDLSEVPIPLFDPKADEDETPKRCGDVRLRFEWLQISPERVEKDCGCIVKVKVDEVYLPEALSEDAVAVVAKIGGAEKSTPFASHAAQAMRKKAAVPAVLRPPPPQDTLELEIEYVMTFTLSETVTEQEDVEISLLTKRKGVLGKSTVPLSEVMSNSSLELALDGLGHRPRMQLMGTGKTIAAEITVTIMGIVRVDQNEARLQMHQRAKLTRAATPRTEDDEKRAAKKNRSNVGKEAGSMLTRYGTICDQSRESLDWFNKFFEKLWPKVHSYIRFKMEDPTGRVNLKLQAKMPRLLNTLHFSRFSLGEKRCPQFGPIKVFKAPERVGQEGMQGVELRLGFSLESDGDIELSVMNLKVGVRSLSIKGELIVRLEPLINEAPVVGGVVICFLDPPKVTCEFSHVARFIDNTILAGKIRSLFDQAISTSLVMPNVLGLNIGTEEQGVDRALLRQPRLLGVLRVTVLRARSLIGCRSRLFCQMRNPYVRLTVADDDFSTSAANWTANPEWGEDEVHDFMVYDSRQKLGIEVLEAFSFQTPIVLGRARPFLVMKAVAESEQPIPLYRAKDVDREVRLEDGDPDEQLEPGPRQGSVELRCEWREPLAAASGVNECDKCIVRLKIDEIFVPAHLLLPSGEPTEAVYLLGVGAVFKAKVGDFQRTTPVAKYYLRKPNAPAGPGVGKTISEFSDGSKIELEVEFILYLLVRTADLDTENIDLELQAKTGPIIGTASVPLSDVMRQPGHTLVFGRHRLLRMDGPGDRGDPEAEINVSVRSLRSVHSPKSENSRGKSNTA